MPLPRHPLPRGRHFAVTWNIPDDFGGMTSTLLRRSRAFVRLGGARVDVLTFAVRDDWAAVEASLRSRGELVEGMRLLNVWAWLGSATQREHYDGDGQLLRIDHFRADGSLVVSDRRDLPEGRSISLLDAGGTALRTWKRTASLYRWWLDRLTGDDRAYFIVDSKTSANFMTGYRRPRAVVAHVVHNSHLTAAGALRPSRRRVLERLDSLDLVVLLTERQRRDVADRLGDRGNLRVIPNPHDVRPEHRPRGNHGLVLASLTARKRVDVAIRAAATAGAHLDVYGDGELREGLGRLVTELGAGGGVRLLGYRPGAREELAAASFVLLTGSSEGFPLVLVEAMAAGCIPIAVDVPYGPADLIRHRVNGFLAPTADDVTAALLELQSLPPRDLDRMRLAARRTAQRYSDAAAVRQWSRELRAAFRRAATGPAVSRRAAASRAGSSRPASR